MQRSGRVFSEVYLLFFYDCLKCIVVCFCLKFAAYSLRSTQGYLSLVKIFTLGKRRWMWVVVGLISIILNFEFAWVRGVTCTIVIITDTFMISNKSSNNNNY